MDALLWLGRLGGLVGVFFALVAGTMRAMGHYTLGSFQVSTLLVAGIAGMVFGCLCLLVVLTAGPARRG